MKTRIKKDGTVEVEGRKVGRVEKVRERTTHMGGSGGYHYAIGFSYRTRWTAYDATGRRIGSWSFNARREAVEAVVAADRN
jgi:hypothetical protein